jgi:hypothetical protein
MLQCVDTILEGVISKEENTVNVSMVGIALVTCKHIA